MLPEDQTVDVVSIDQEEHEWGVKLRNSKPVVEPQTELKLEAIKKVELESGSKLPPEGVSKDIKPEAE